MSQSWTTSAVLCHHQAKSQTNRTACELGRRWATLELPVVTTGSLYREQTIHLITGDPRDMLRQGQPSKVKQFYPVVFGITSFRVRNISSSAVEVKHIGHIMNGAL